MIPERRHRNRADQRERPGQRLGQRTATLASDGEHAVHTLQRTLGNQAVQELRSRGALGAAVTTGPPVAGPAPESEPATATEEQLEEEGTVPGEQEAPLEAGDAEPGAGPEAEGEAGAKPAAEGAEAEADAEAEAAAEAEAEEAPATEPGTGAAGEAPVAGPTSPSSPDEDPAFQAVVEQIETVATREQSHPPPRAASAQAQAAAEGPKKEVENRAAARQIGEMAEQQPNEFDREAFKRALKDKIEQVAPKSLKQADEFKDRNELPAVKRDLTGTVDKQKEQSQKPIAETTRAKPDTSGIEPKPFTPLDPPSAGSPPPDVGAGRAAPKPKTEHEVAAPFRERSQQLDQQMAAEGVTEEQLAKAPDPEFDAALQTKRDAQTHAAQAPAAYRQHEQGVLSGARTEAETAAQSETLAMHDSRSQQLDTVGSLQEQTKSKDEQERAAVSAKLQEIYDRTTQRVTDRLDKLDADVNKAFDDGAEAARQQFEDHVAERMRQYKEARYSGVRGKIRWATDKLEITTLPKRVERYYVEGRNIYLKAMDTVIDGIATIVQTGLGEAQSIIAEGRTEVNKYLSSLPESLKAVGQQAASDIQTRFDALEQTVEARKEQLINSLAQKYTEKLQAVDARIEELKAQNRSLFERAWDAVGGVIKTIIELKNMLLGVLRKAASAASTIIQAPIEFLGNLVDGVKLGFQNFVANIWTHLQRGLISWLTGTMAEAGIQLPETFDLKGIFSLVMQLLGLTYENIRAQAVKVLGEEAVSALEKGFEMFKILVTEGVAGLWAFVKEKIGDLKAMVLDKIKELVITSVIEAGIKWILGLLNPVGAFIKACKAIYDIVTFFFERAREILTLVDAIMDSILAIAQGNLAGAAKFVEDALAKAIPLVIGFLANLLGLGDLPEKVKGVVAAIQAPINKAIQWVLEQAKAAAQRLGRALGIGEQPPEPEKPPTTEVGEVEDENSVSAGLAAIDTYEERQAENGALTRDDAEKIADRVKSQYPVFSKLEIVDGDDSWDYHYEASPVDTKPGLPKAEETAYVTPEIIWDEIVAQMSSTQETETRLSSSSAEYCRTVLFEMIAKSDAPPADQQNARAAVAGLLGEASEARDGDRIYSKVRQAQGVVNGLLRDNKVDIQLQTHHVERVSEHVETFVDTKRGRLYIPVRYQREIEEWAAGLSGLSASEIENRRRELISLTRDQLMSDQRVHFEKKLEEINLIVVTRVQHVRIHQEERTQERGG